MKTVNIGRTGIKASRIALGCMNFGGSWRQKEDAGTIMKRAMVAMECALEEGINFFDHADIYMGGHSEEVFSNIWKLKPGLRDKIILQSKCGIRFPSGQGEDTVVKYDFSKEHICSLLKSYFTTVSSPCPDGKRIPHFDCKIILSLSPGFNFQIFENTSSECPPIYMSAWSKKFIPSSKAHSMATIALFIIVPASSFCLQLPPKFMHPSAILEALIPVLPIFTVFILPTPS